MSPRVRRWLVVGSALVAVIAAVITVVYFFQPWRSCDDEDTSAGCAMLPTDATVMAAAMVVTVLAVGALVLALLAKDRSAAR